MEKDIDIVWKCLLLSSVFLNGTVIWLPGVDATSWGSQSDFDGSTSTSRLRRAAGNNVTISALTAGPSPEFFVEGIVDKFGVDGKLNREQLQVLLQRVNAECYTSEEILSIHSLTEEQLLNDSNDAIITMSPTMLYQAASEDCSGLNDSKERIPPTMAQVWGYGILFVTVINMSSLMGACIIPCLDKKVYKMILTYMIGLAVGTLSGNAVLSLIPETHGMLVSTHGLDFVWRNTTIVGGIYLFFFVERILKLISNQKDANDKKRKQASKPDDSWHVTGVSDSEPNPSLYMISAGDRDLPGVHADSVNISSNNGNALQRREEVLQASTPNGDAHSHLALVEDGKIRIASVAYMIVFGDGLHNFVDGLAIGASFAISVFQGISTSIAVICEEFPHELGDFAILLKSGMSVKQALAFNFMSALTCYFGLIIGILVGQLTSAEPFIFALAAGMFLYISLVDMLPELNTVDDQQEFNLRQSLKTFAIQNGGLLTGYGIMVVLAVYREHITI